jgi:type VI secretion system secreted protein VgrG
MAIIRSKSEADYTIKTGSLPADKLKVVSFFGSEGISELFRFSVDLASSDKEIDFDAAVGQPTLLTIHGPKEKRYINGIVSLFEQTGKTGKLTRYRAEVVPTVWMLSRRSNCRIFQNLAVPAIIKQVLTDGGVASDQFEFSLKKTYQPRDYCVQYRESDLSFISRLMEQYGLFYFFKHTADQHVMVIGDDAVVHVPIAEPATVRYRAPGTAGVSDQEHVSEYRFNREIRSGAIKLQDFDFKKPRLNMGADAKAGDGKLEVYDYPGEYGAPDEGSALAKVRLEELQATRQVGSGQSDCRRLIPGYRFTLDQYDRSDCNREYVVVRVSHSGNQPQTLGADGGDGAGEDAVYQNQFECIPSDVPFRPPRTTPKPVVQGPQTAIAVGPKGEEIYTDEHGRVKVQFHWDRQGKRDEKSSCWIRVGQLWAGSGWGAMFIPRIGQEVIVEFLEGDPDQPIITGRVYNGDNLPPYGLPAEKTKSTIKSNTSKGGGTANELLIEDLKDKSQVVLSSAYGHKLTQDEESQTFTLETRDQNLIRFDDKNKSITIQTTNKHQMVFDDENKKTVIKSTDGYTVELDDENKKMTLLSKNGQKLEFDDEDNRKITLVTEDGNSIVIDDNEEKISVVSKGGHSLTLDDSGENVTIEDSQGNLVKLDTGGGKIVIEVGSGDIDITASSGKISLSAMDIEIAATNEVKVSGGSKGTFDGGIESSVKGVTTKVEGSAMTEVKGALVKIN